MKFDGKILVIGCGSVAQCVLPLILKLIDVPTSKIKIIDFVDNRAKVQDVLSKGVGFEIVRITEENYRATLANYVGAGDMIIDLAWNIGCVDIVSWCHENNVLYLNTSVEVWDPYGSEERNDPRPHTLYTRHLDIAKMIDRWGGNKGSTAIVDHGANPGLVSHFAKAALIGIAERLLAEKPADRRCAPLKEALASRQFNKIAQIVGLKTIHVSERDTQIADRPKEVNEFVNTWSIEGFYEEGVAPAEMGWGTHERNIPANIWFYDEGPKNQVCLSSIGVKTWCRSWVPCGEITGMVIRHGEAFSLSHRLTVWEGDKAVYRPTVHYVYCPCDAAINSLHELEMRQYALQANQRIMSDEIVSGRDELGVLLMGHDFNSWWTGSLLDIEETRRLIPHQNATTLQVAISVVAAAIWAMRHPQSGFCLPDDLDHDEVLEICRPFLGPFVNTSVDWTPLKNLDLKYTSFGEERPNEEDMWQFTTFAVDPQTRAGAKKVEQPMLAGAAKSGCIGAGS